MKTVGIIGGLGPETTAKFYMEIVFACSKIARQRPKILISNVALPLEIEKEIILEAKGTSKVLPFLLDSARQLEKGGADFIVIPCNTVHVFIDEIRASVDIPVLSIIEEAVVFLQEQNIKKVGFLATKTTIKNGIFTSKFKGEDLEIEIPNVSDQDLVVKIIHNLVVNKSTAKDKNEFQKVVKRLNEKNILLACTDLQLLHSKVENVRIFDTLDILLKATVRKILS